MTDYVRKQDPLSGAQNIKEGSMQDRHTRQSLGNLADRMRITSKGL